MVSGFVTSPKDQLRISSGEAILSCMKSKSADCESLDLGKSIIRSAPDQLMASVFVVHLHQAYAYSFLPSVTLRPNA